MLDRSRSSDADSLSTDVKRLVRRGHHAVVAGTLRAGERRVRGWSSRGTIPDATSVFEIGSVTKALTGVLLADAVVRGEVDLADPLSKHLPAPRPAWRAGEPTLLQLATHRSGLPNTPRSLHCAELRYAVGLRQESPWASITNGEYRKLVSAESPRRAPGERARYSSIGVGLLGDALAARTGTDYQQLLTTRILAPLGMHDTFVTLPEDRARRLLTGHSRTGRLRPPLDDLMPAAGSLRSTAADLLTFLEACLHPPPGALGEALVLARQPHARMGGAVDVGLCWMSIDTRDRGRMVWHNGGTWGFRSFAGFTAERGSAAVVLSDTARSVDTLGLHLA